MAAVEFPVEALGSAVGNGAWCWAPGPSLSPRSRVCFRAGERLPAHCAIVVMARDYGDRIAVAVPGVGDCFQTEARPRAALWR
jgi:hypothetical protein